MLQTKSCGFGLLLLPAYLLYVCCSVATAQDKTKPPAPNDPRLNSSFPIQPGAPPMRFKVGLNQAGHVTGLSVFHAEDSAPFQTLPRCAIIDVPESVSEDWEAYQNSVLLTHADLNFDGFEDLQLLTYYVPHLDKKMYCIYLWDNKAGRFRYSNALSELAVNPVPHPESKTVVMHENWEGGLWTESTYRWNGPRPELIEQNRLRGDGTLPSIQKCGFTFTCSKLVDAKMITTLEKLVCSQTVNLPACPASGWASKLNAEKRDSSTAAEKQ
jgi:hypothetical protein